jgi:hypothetical protein
MTGITVRLGRSVPIRHDRACPVHLRTDGRGRIARTRPPPIGQTRLPVSSHDETGLNKKCLPAAGRTEGDNDKDTQTSCSGDSGDRVLVGRPGIRHGRRGATKDRILRDQTKLACQFRYMMARRGQNGSCLITPYRQARAQAVVCGSTVRHRERVRGDSVGAL